MENINKFILDLISNNFATNEDKIISLLSTGFQFRLIDSDDNLSFSKFGETAEWSVDSDMPKHNDETLSFLCQIDLSEINHSEPLLPKKGILYFFMLKNENEFPDKKGEFKVIYSENYPSVNNRTTKDNDKKIIFAERLTFPSYQEYIMEENNISEEESNSIDEIESEVFIKTNDIIYDIEHQILGHPAAVQGTVRYWWAMKYLQLDEYIPRTKEEMKIIQDEEENFVLLLQVNFSDPAIVGFDCFGDGIAYFGIHKKDLENNNFENVILIMQNT